MYVIVGLTAVYTMFLLALSKIALSVLIALGPVFIALLFFETTKRFFESWIAQLSQLCVPDDSDGAGGGVHAAGGLHGRAGGGGAGGGIEIAHAVKVCVAAALTFLVMKQVPAMAQGLASGVALSSFGAVSRLVRCGLGRRAWRRAEREGFLARRLHRSRTRAAGTA